MEEDEAAPPTGCWIRLPRLGSGCMSSGSKVDSSTSGACGNGAGKNAPQLLQSYSYTWRFFPCLLNSLRSSGSLRLGLISYLTLVCTFDSLLLCLCVCIHTPGCTHGRAKIVFGRSRWQMPDLFFNSVSL
jgi:hypothetical protein